MPRLAVILPAGGTSTRFGGPTNKLLESLHGKTVIERSFAAFTQRTDVAQVVVATNLAFEISDSKLRFCAGGATRAHSVHNALLTVPAGIEWVAVHDAARPLVTQALIDRTFAAAIEHGAAAPAMPVNLTIKQATGPLPARVEKTIPREKLWALQTPQIMRRQSLLRAFEKCPIPLEQITDDVQLLELLGEAVYLVAGDEQNLKITTQLDLRLAELLSS